MSTASARPHAGSPSGLRPGLLVASRWLGNVKILIPFAALVVIWSAIQAVGHFPERVLVSPSRVWDTMLLLFSHGILVEYIRTSIAMIFVATAISLAIGVPLGFLVGSNRYAARALETFLRYLQGISGIAWLPLVVIWFGFTHLTTLAIVIYTLAVPIIFNTMTGVRAVPEHYALGLRSLGAGRLRVIRDVYLPGALPSIMVGLRLGMGYGWRALIAAEMLVRQGGLGDLIFGARTSGQIDRIIGGMIVIGALYIIIDRLLVQPLENLTIARWGLLRK